MKSSVRAWITAAALAASLGAIPAARAGYVIDGNIFFNNTGGAYFDAATTAKVNVFTHNDPSSDPLLGDPYNTTNPNWVPAFNSPANALYDDVVNVVLHQAECSQDGCRPNLQAVCWRGALAPAFYHQTDWTQGWTYHNFNGAGRTDIDYGKPLVIVQGDITTSTNFVNTNNYLLRGRVRVEPPATLFIQEGTVVFGEKSTVGFLMIDRGAQILALGTAARPIILTSDQAPGSMAPGDFGGLVINGRAIANCADCLGGASCISEGTDAEHCGTNDCDTSGRLEYMRVEYAGHEVSPNNELNAFTFNSLGSGTTVHYLNSFRGSDDLFEWFGGAVNCDHFVGQGGADDGLDWQMGFRGSVQFAIIQQWGDGSDKGIEADNNEFNFNAPCRSNPVFSNITLINTGGTTSTHGVHLRRGTDVQLYNSIIMGWLQSGLRVQNTESCATAYADPGVYACPTADVPPVEEAAALLVRTFPNPVTQSAHFFFNLPQSGPTRLQIFDGSGRAVANLVNEDLSAGSHQVVWDLGSNAAGTYFYRMESNGNSSTGRLVAVR